MSTSSRPSRDGTKPAWWIYQGTGQPRLDLDLAEVLPPPPPWRNFTGQPLGPPPTDNGEESVRRLGGAVGYLPADQVDPHEVDMVNAAIYLRRPLLVTGKPGVGKSSLAYRIARELGLGPVLRWAITSKSVLEHGLYEYDPIGRAQVAGMRRANAVPSEIVAEPDIGEYLKLGPLGTALLPYELPRVVLIDELDKSDIDLPNDLLNVFEDGDYRIRELVRVAKRQPDVSVMTADPDGVATIKGGYVRCCAFPIVVITSNGERAFPAPFKRRCLRLTMRDPGEKQLASMIAAHFPSSGEGIDRRTTELIKAFLERSSEVGGLAADQLFNAVYLATSGAFTPGDEARNSLAKAVWHQLAEDDSG